MSRSNPRNLEMVDKLLETGNIRRSLNPPRCDLSHRDTDAGSELQGARFDDNTLPSELSLKLALFVFRGEVRENDAFTVARRFSASSDVEMTAIGPSSKYLDR
jgi:hypothetical protein